VDVDEEKLERWEIKAERAAGALKTSMFHDIKVLIRDCEDDPLLIWKTLKTLFIQQWTAPCFNAYYTLLSVEKLDSETLDSLINRVDKQIRVIKLLSPSSLSSLSQTLQNRASNCPKYDFCSHLSHIEAKCFLKEKLMHQISLPSSFTATSASTTPSNLAFLLGSTILVQQIASLSSLLPLPLDLSLWHHCLCHHHLAGIKKLLSDNLVMGFRLNSQADPF
jgi:hypothetical protein